MKFRQVAQILESNGFERIRQKGSHQTYRGTVNGKTAIVVLAFSSAGEDVRAGTLASIIRQSGLPRKLFRSD
jgi:predicted RNA binding protein YcfA (HicA-like mRNA interferase family)